MKGKTLVMLMAVLSLASCSKQIETADKKSGKIAPQFTTQIQTRAAGNSWSANDQIGIFMIESGNNLAPLYIVNSADNVAYKTASAGASASFSPVDPSQTIYFPQSGNVDFISYYPHKSPITKYMYPIDVTDQSNQEAIDLLYSNNAVGKNSSASSVAFNFKHKLSKLTIKVKTSGEYTKSELEAMVVKVKGLNTGANFVLATGAISGAQLLADITVKTVSAGVSYEAIVIPVTPLTGASIEFIIGGKSLSWAIKTPAYVEGNRYNYDLVLGTNGVTVDGSTIEDWEDNNEPGDSPIRKIVRTTVDNMEINYNSTSEDGRINEIRFREVNPMTGQYVTNGFADIINITYNTSPLSVTMQGSIPSHDAIDIYGKGTAIMAFNAVYTLNATGLASSATIESTIENSESTYTTTYLYNADNQLISVVENDALGEKVSVCTAEWDQGSLISTVIGAKMDINTGGETPTPGPGPGVKGTSTSEEWDEYTETYTYNTTINKGGALYPRTLASIYYAQGAIGVFASVVGILGKGPKNLVAKLTDSNNYTTVYNYTFYEASLYPQYVTLTDPTDPERAEKVMLMFK